MKKPIRIMLVEDNPSYQKVIALALEEEPDLELIHQFGTAEIALRSLEQGQLSATPDLVLLDLRLPGMDGLDAVSWFKKAAPQVKIIILSQSNNEADVLRAIQLGAAGYLLKSASVDQITEGIRTVFKGGASLDPSLAKLIIDNLKERLPAPSPGPTLSTRETEILKLLAQGMVKKEIASHLGIGYTTVETHVQKIYEKFGVQNAPAAVSKGHRMGILHLDQEDQ